MNDFNHDFFTDTYRTIVEILEEFHIMISREMVENDQSDDSGKKIDDYLRKFLMYI